MIKYYKYLKKSREESKNDFISYVIYIYDLMLFMLIAGGLIFITTALICEYL